MAEEKLKVVKYRGRQRTKGHKQLNLSLPVELFEKIETMRVEIEEAHEGLTIDRSQVVRMIIARFFKEE